MGYLSAYVNLVAHSSIFKNVIMGCILLNTVTFAMSASIEVTEENMIYVLLFEGIDNCFLGIYTIEFIIKIYTLGRGYWFNGFNCFDFGILAFSHLQLVLSYTGAKNFGVIKVMRSLRALRPLRSISLIGGLQVVVTALIETLSGSFIHIITLLNLLMFVYGIMGFYAYGYNPDVETEKSIEGVWSSFGYSYLSLFVLMTAEGWTIVQRSLTDNSPTFAKYGFIISFLFIAHFIFGNLFVAVVIEQIDKANHGYQRRIDVRRTTVILRKRKRAKNEQEREIRGMIDKEKALDFKTFPKVVLEMYGAMRYDEFVINSDRHLNELWIESANQEYDRLSKEVKKIRRFHLECIQILGEMVCYMDEEAQNDLFEQAVREQYLMRDRRKTSFFGRLSMTSALAGVFLPGMFQKESQSQMEEKEEEEEEGVNSNVDASPFKAKVSDWCVVCLRVLSNCRCINPERERLQRLQSREDASGTNEQGHRLSALTEKWLATPSGPSHPRSGSRPRPSVIDRMRHLDE